MAEDGTVLGVAEIDNEAAALAGELAKAGPAPRVALEATCGWCWAADVLAEEGARVHLAIRLE
jgi:hypothetical protein